MNLEDSQPIISMRGITKRFPGMVALNDVSLDIQRGELHAICGENGAGKSTLMKILSGVYTEYEGELSIRGQRVQFSGSRDAEAAGVSIIHQELNLVEELTAAANVFLGREIRTSWGLLNDRAMEAATLELFSQLECSVSPRVTTGSLRIGDQQLLEIAKALSLQSEILIMDEPTSALTESEVERLYRVIAKLRKRGATILYISHKMDEVFRLADRITVLRDGRLVKTVVRSETNPREITHWMVGREIESSKFATRPEPGAETLRVKGLSLPWPGHVRGWRLKDVSFSLRSGEIVGVAGLMGAGRTELLESIFGARSESLQGEIFLEGKPVRFFHPSEAKRAGVAMVTEDRKRLGLFPDLNVGANISICQLAAAAKGGVVNPWQEGRLVRDSIGKLSVKTAGPKARITSLSGGNQQKCIIARWLLTEPKVLLLDDPTRGIDVGAKAELYQLMDTLCRSGLSILITSSELPELLTVCDRILVLAEGRLTGEFARVEATEQKIMEAATLGKLEVA